MYFVSLLPSFPSRMSVRDSLFTVVHGSLLVPITMSSVSQVLDK